MRTLLRVVLAVLTACGLLIATAAAGVTSAGASSKYPPIPAGPINIGVSTPLSGAEASYGIFTQDGFKVAMAYFNQEHPNGIDGHKVNLILLNDASSVTTAVSVANQLVADKVAAVVTLTTDPAAAFQQLVVFAKAKVPVIANLELTTQASNATLAKEYPYLFSPNPSLAQTGVAALNWIKSKGFKNVGILNDGIPYDTLFANLISTGLKKDKIKTTTVNISPGAVDDAAAITQLKSSGAQLLVVTAGESYGPIWESVLASGWSPTILSSAGAWYSGFTSMGALTSKASAYYYQCANSATQTFTSVQNSLMAQFANATDNLVVNYLTFLATDSVPLEIANYAITKYHSVSPQAMQAAILGIHNQEFLGLKYSFSPTNHFGLTGEYGPAVCHMGAPYAGGVGKVPVKS
jgi:ABC-type branched-subunit amino acid transport system substrate-binding protein